MLTYLEHDAMMKASKDEEERRKKMQTIKVELISAKGNVAETATITEKQWESIGHLDYLDVLSIPDMIEAYGVIIAARFIDLFPVNGRYLAEREAQ